MQSYIQDSLQHFLEVLAELLWDGVGKFNVGFHDEVLT